MIPVVNQYTVTTDDFGGQFRFRLPKNTITYTSTFSQILFQSCAPVQTENFVGNIKRL
jgi:hypothetical protein